MELNKYIYISPFGKIEIIMNGERVKSVSLGKFKKSKIKGCGIKIIDDSLDEYFKKGKEILLKKVPLCWEELRGKEKEVLKYLREKVKLGEVITYSKLAQIFQTSPRRIGQIMRKNPFPIFIPCHRVIGKRNIGGYTPDLRWKRALLKIEER